MKQLRDLIDTEFDQMAGGGFCHDRPTLKTFSAQLNAREIQHHQHWRRSFVALAQYMTVNAG